MVLAIDVEGDDYRFFKTLNEDVQLKPVSPTSKHYDIQMENGDYANVTGKDSLYNAIVIAILTRFNELSSIDLYEDFGCRAHELIKANVSSMVNYEIELFIVESLEKIRRIKKINSVELIENEDNYIILFNVTAVNDQQIEGSVTV